jgi:hypothetical protein
MAARERRVRRSGTRGEPVNPNIDGQVDVSKIETMSEMKALRPPNRAPGDNDVDVDKDLLRYRLEYPGVNVQRS